jgi:hypothetical protein
MRKAYIGILVLLTLLVMGLAGAAFAADTEETTKVGKDVYFTLGYKVWYNTWQTPFNSYAPTGGANIMTITSESVAAPIISASLKISNFLIAGSFMDTPDYKFPDYEDVLATGPTYSTPFNVYRTTASRKEHDINIGYYVAPTLALTVGYKEVKQTYNDIDIVTGATNFSAWTKYSGPIVGITGGGSIGGGFAFYGNLSYGFLKGEFEGDPQKFDATYSSTELGIAYRPVSFLSLLVGYKYQTIDSKLKDPAFNNQVALDVTKGFIFGANLTF